MVTNLKYDIRHIMCGSDRQIKPSFSLKSLILLVLLIVSILAAIATTNAQASTWELTINGLVDHPLVLTLDDLKNMPQTTELASIYCVDFPQNVVAEGKWTGVSLATLLQRAGIQQSAIKVAFFAADGYTTDLDLTTAANRNVIVAYSLDSSSLGETLRLVVPGRWGYKWIYQLTTITLMDYDYKGKWESQGYSDDAIAHPDSVGARSPISQTYPSPISTQTNTTTAPTQSPIPVVENNSSNAPPQNTQNSKPELEPQAEDGAPSALEIAAIVGIAAVVASTVLVMRRRLLKARL